MVPDSGRNSPAIDMGTLKFPAGILPNDHIVDLQRPGAAGRFAPELRRGEDEVEAAALEESADRGVRLVALEFLVGAEVGVRVGETHHKAHCGLAVVEVVKE